MSSVLGEWVRQFVMQLDATLRDDVRQSVAHAFGELLTNAIEWGGGLDLTRKVRIACARGGCPCTASPIRAKASTSID